jgi:hypothetical protein
LRFDTKSGGGELLKKHCLIRRHLKVIMVVDGDEKEDVIHICPIMCAELLSGGIFFFSCLEGRQKLGHSGHPVIWTIRGVE